MSVRALGTLLLLLGAAAAAPPPVAPGAAPTYADLVDLSLGAPIIVRASVGKAERLDKVDAPDVAPGSARLLVSATIDTALRAPQAIAAGVSYLVELPLDARGKPPTLKGAAVLLFLRPGTAPGQYVLAAPRAQLAASAAVEATVRAILADNAQRSVPTVTGIAQAFNVPGAVPGEAESQFFLSTASGKPVSLVVLSRPGQAKALSVALGDVVDDAALGVRRETLLWYRLACFLPRTLPGGVATENRAALAADYGFVLATLGACERRL